MVGFHLHLIQFWPLNLKSIENMAIQQNICLYTFAQCWKTKLRRTKLQRYLHIGLACAKGFKKQKGESLPRLLKNLQRTDYRDTKLAFICAW